MTPRPPKKISQMLGKSGVGGGVLSYSARGGHATAPMRPLKPAGPAKVTLTQKAPLTAQQRALQDKQRAREAMD